MNDGRKVITIAHPEQSSGELKMLQATGCIVFMFFLFFFVYYTTPTVSLIFTIFTFIHKLSDKPGFISSAICVFSCRFLVYFCENCFGQ